MNDRISTFARFWFRYATLLMGSVLLFTACASRPPANPNDLCQIFSDNRSWYKSAVAMQERWDVPLHVPMAIMYQESGFDSDAKPPRTYTFFGLIPWGRESSAYGYSQALDGTWEQYLQETNRRWGDRSDFHDAIDFMGWYIDTTRRVNKISPANAGKQYLNYHEGWSGYKRKTHLQKSWLLKVTGRVDRRAQRYKVQYQSCEEELSRGFWYRLFH